MSRASSTEDSRARRRFGAALGLGALAALSALLPACAKDDTCVTTRTYFEQNVWSPFMGSKCTKCHTPDGVGKVRDGVSSMVDVGGERGVGAPDVEGG